MQQKIRYWFGTFVCQACRWFIWYVHMYVIIGIDFCLPTSRSNGILFYSFSQDPTAFSGSMEIGIRFSNEEKKGMLSIIT